ncbi:ABC-2 type transport system permease protein [Amycolatopsis bartoniae]|uniref:Transport permease protein n=1 Tax=Amycolatopsis bartoniae TaxID=941986 RepID=A0A8H9IVJ0_9PSEU|nr:ABC transporter permease [Amycolatopsis bartoniae]MBB2934736.1 ABC-2 type transport system permease protein [Amycolatopsis bartoniae]TVT01199.1 ABC transporter permease subunit [Amycolatopsis bartoniae]GHF45146.1 transport permease protein [Amycolatopsis bartoniae]
MRDTWLIFKRDLVLSLRNPAWLMIGIMQPVLYLVLFGPLMEKVVSNTPGFPPGSSWTILTPALIVQLALFSSSFAGFGLLVDYRSGVLERLRVTPASRLGLLLGKVLNNAVQAVVQAILITVLAYLVFGLDAPVGGVLLSLVIVALTAVTLASASYAVALTLKSEQAFPALLNAVLMPVLLLSGILLPITSILAPNWLYTLSRINPFTHVVDSERATFRGDFTFDGLYLGGIVLVVLAALAVFWGARTFQRENA